MAKIQLDESERLALIVEAVKYCQRVSAMGMPVSSYTKALREPIYFLWELRGGKSKDVCAQFRSKDAMGKRRGTGDLIYDHAVPFRYLQKELLDLTDVTRDAVREILNRYCVVVLITKKEHSRLGHTMREGWTSWRDRYADAGIETLPNE